MDDRFLYGRREARKDRVTRHLSCLENLDECTLHQLSKMADDFNDYASYLPATSDQGVNIRYEGAVKLLELKKGGREKTVNEMDLRAGYIKFIGEVWNDELKQQPPASGQSPLSHALLLESGPPMAVS
jgi:hypothetical protein